MIRLFKSYKHILPRAKAFSITLDKNLRRFFLGISKSGDDLKLYFDLIYLDLFPQTTRELELWEYQWNLQGADNLSDAERRERLSAVWKAKGGQSPKYIQDTLQSYGFDVYVFDWWIDGTEPPLGFDDPPATPKNPAEILGGDYTDKIVQLQCGEQKAQCGEPEAVCGNSLTIPGYILINKDTVPVPKVIAQCGEPIMACGELQALCGNFFSYKDEISNPEIPTDPSYWPYFAYVGGRDFGQRAPIPASRRSEFEDLVLSLMPAHLWIGLIVQYTNE